MEKLPCLKTPRLELQAFRETDLPAAKELLCSAEVAKSYMLPEFKCPDEAEPLFRRLTELSLSKEHFVYGIYLHDRLIGFLNDVEITDGEMELGYVIHPAHWNCGYMTEALAAATEELFRLGFRRVVAGHFKSNPASGRVMAKCGMTKLDKTDEIEYRGVTHRCIYYAIEK